MTINLKSLLQKAKQERRASISENKANNETCHVILRGIDESNKSIPTVINDVGISSGIRGISISNDFITPISASKIFDALNLSSKGFVQLRGRKCIPYGGRVTDTGLVASDDIPEWLSVLMNRVHQHLLEPRGLPAPNHALINVYEPGEGVMPHEDGPAYTPYATILSLGSAAVFDFHQKSTPPTPIAKVFLPVGSLLLFTNEAYTNTLHEYSFSKTDSLITSMVFNSEAARDVPDRLGSAELVSDGTLLRRAPPSTDYSITIQYPC